MDSIDRLKLAIYESGLDDEDQEALLDYVEEAVLYEGAAADIARNTVDIGSKAVFLSGIGVGADGAINAGSAATKLAKNQIKKLKLKKEIEEINEKLKGDISPNKAVSLAAKLAKNKSEIAIIDQKIKSLKPKLAEAGLQTAAGAGLAGIGGSINLMADKRR